MSKIDINKYLGKWYEIARIPTVFQRDMTKVTAEYVLNEDKTINVINSGYVNGELIKVTATALTTDKDDLLKIIDKLNRDNAVHGILVQLPLPKHISEKNVIERISPIKDVDAFHPTNVGKIMIGDYSFLPCTPAGVIELLDYYKIDICSKKCVVLGRSNIVGKPMAMLLMQRNGTVTICHSKTNDIESICKEADIIVCAIGKCEFLKANMIKPGAVVIDVGINRDSNGKLCGDVKFDEAKEVASMITPVPGGVGPMTITMLMKNTLMAAKIQTEERK